MLKLKTFKRTLAVPAVLAALSLATVCVQPAQARHHHWQAAAVYPNQFPKDDQWHAVSFNATVLHPNGHEQLRVMADDSHKYTCHAKFQLNGWTNGRRVHITALERDNDVHVSHIWAIG